VEPTNQNPHSKLSILKIPSLTRFFADVEEYAEHVRCVMGAVPETWIRCSEVVYRAGEEGGVWQRPRTRYERRAAEMGHNIYEFEYRLSKNS
jgi:tRNA G46 methylase TrmB